jgi:hypothetical protein
MLNFAEEGRPLFDVTVPGGPEELEIAPFIQYDFDTDSPELLTTLGRRCPTYSIPLHAKHRPYPLPIFTRKERLLFHDRESFAPLVDQALDHERDISLRAEVQRYRAYTRRSRGMALRLAAMKEEYDETRRVAQQSIERLAAADGYWRIRDRIESEVLPTDVIPPSVKAAGMRDLRDKFKETPTRIDEQCNWCGKENHDTHDCSMLRQCLLCNRWGHIEYGCHNPHKYCVGDDVCNVPNDHPRWLNNSCPSETVYGGPRYT